ncbi:hsp70 family protein [Gigaspora margarita]|uniref:Hsp70 family protein n=1 Tax=Gigaspora margarita TaxID=4874 RepID=A0A8H4EMS6_GIGMA|nr:hsp70 family protein [Gigaspora margarita]
MLQKEFVYVERHVYQFDFLPEVPTDIRVVVGIGFAFANVETCEIIKEDFERRWPGIDFFRMVRLVFTVPAEFTEKTKSIMRQCIYDAGLINNSGTQNLKFITEPEAAAIYCMNVLKDHRLKSGVDLTVRKLLDNNQLGEVTEHSGDVCGGAYVDKEFLRFLEDKVGNGNALDKLEEDDWEIDIDFETIKSFFDPVVNRIIRLISIQHDECKCNVMFLIGGFSESKYLQQTIKQRFSQCKVAVPPYLTAAAACGAVEYGLDMDTVKNRVLKWTYGIKVYPKFEEGDLPLRKESDGHIYKFLLMAKRGVQVEVDQRFSETMYPSKPDAMGILFSFYYTAKKTAEYCDEPGMHKLGEFDVDLPDTHLGKDRPVTLEYVLEQ